MYSTVQYFKYSTVLYSAVQYSTVLHVQYCTVQYSTGCSWQILMKLELSEQIFENSSNKFHEKSSRWSQVFQCGWTDRWTDMLSYCTACSVIVRRAQLYT